MGAPVPGEAREEGPAIAVKLQGAALYLTPELPLCFMIVPHGALSAAWMTI